MVPRQLYIHLYENVCMAQRHGFRTGRALEQPAHLTLTPSNISPPHPPSSTRGSGQAHLPGTHPDLMLVESLGGEDTLEKEMATYSSILSWEIPWTEESGELRSMGLQRIRYD